MRLSIILTSVAWVFGRTSAATTTLNSTVLSPSPDFTANAQTPGPLFLDQVIPLRLYLGAGNTPAAGQFSETSDLQNSICPNGGQFNYKLNSNANNAIMTSANIFIIYYSNGKISSSHSKSIQNFVANIGSTNYWNKVLQYTYNGTPAKPVFTTSVSINPSTQKSYGTSMQAGNAQDLLLYVFTANPNLKDVNGLYVIILGTDITFTKDSNVMGKGTNSVGTDIYCGIHDIYICTTALNNGCTINGNNVNYRYMVVGMPKGFSNGDKCSGIFPFQTPNSDSSLDHSIYFIAHELIETVISYQYVPPGTTTCGTTCNGAWTDACQLQASDKCSGILTNLLYMSSPVVSLPTWISFGSVYSSVSLYNIIVGGQKFILPPVWDNSQSACTMGGVVPSSSSSSAGSCTNAPATNSLGQCGPGFGSCPTPSNPYCSQYGNCGSTSDYSTKAQTAFNYCGGASTSSTTSSSSSSSCLYSPASPTGGQCGAGVGSCPSSSNPYCSQYGNCGSTSAYSTNGQSAYNYCK